MLDIGQGRGYGRGPECGSSGAADRRDRSNAPVGVPDEAPPGRRYWPAAAIGASPTIRVNTTSRSA